MFYYIVPTVAEKLIAAHQGNEPWYYVWPRLDDDVIDVLLQAGANRFYGQPLPEGTTV